MEQFWKVMEFASKWLDVYGVYVAIGAIATVAILMVTVWRKKFF